MSSLSRITVPSRADRTAWFALAAKLKRAGGSKETMRIARSSFLRCATTSSRPRSTTMSKPSGKRGPLRQDRAEEALDMQHFAVRPRTPLAAGEDEGGGTWDGDARARAERPRKQARLGGAPPGQRTEMRGEDVGRHRGLGVGAQQGSVEMRDPRGGGGAEGEVVQRRRARFRAQTAKAAEQGRPQAEATAEIHLGEQAFGRPVRQPRLVVAIDEIGRVLRLEARSESAEQVGRGTVGGGEKDQGTAPGSRPRRRRSARLRRRPAHPPPRAPHRRRGCAIPSPHSPGRAGRLRAGRARRR